MKKKKEKIPDENLQRASPMLMGWPTCTTPEARAVSISCEARYSWEQLTRGYPLAGDLQRSVLIPLEHPTWCVQHKSSRKYQSNFLLKSLHTGKRDLCDFPWNRANGFVFPEKTEYLKKFLYQTFPSLLGFSLFLLLSSFFSGASESGAKLSDLSPHREISEDWWFDSWFDFLLLELGSEDSAAAAIRRGRSLWISFFLNLSIRVFGF